MLCEKSLSLSKRAGSSYTSVPAGQCRPALHGGWRSGEPHVTWGLRFDDKLQSGTALICRHESKASRCTQNFVFGRSDRKARFECAKEAPVSHGETNREITLEQVKDASITREVKNIIYQD